MSIKIDDQYSAQVFSEINNQNQNHDNPLIRAEHIDELCVVTTISLMVYKTWDSNLSPDLIKFILTPLRALKPELNMSEISKGIFKLSHKFSTVCLLSPFIFKVLEIGLYALHVYVMRAPSAPKHYQIIAKIAPTLETVAKKISNLATWLLIIRLL